MEIGRTVRTSTESTLRQGDLVRVRILKQLADKSFLVEIRGSIHRARLRGSIPNSLFIGRVLRLKPYVLKFVRTLGKAPIRKGGVPTRRFRGPTGGAPDLDRLLAQKKSIIRPLLTTDNSLEGVPLFEIKGRKEVKRSLKRFISRFTRSFTADQRVNDYLVLQNLSNLLSFQTYSFLFPVMLRGGRSLFDVKLLGSGESVEKGFVLHVHGANETKITFVVFIDYEVIQCTVSANREELEGQVRERIRHLEGGLRSAYYNRRVDVRVVPFDEGDENHLVSLKKIDLQM
jgi:hypothetical protein